MLPIFGRPTLFVCCSCVAASHQAHGGIGQDEDGVWDPFSLEDLLSAGLEAHLEAVAVISATAQREWCVSTQSGSVSYVHVIVSPHRRWEGPEEAAHPCARLPAGDVSDSTRRCSAG